MKEEYRVTKLKEYMEKEILTKLLSYDDFIVNVNFLDLNREDYSLNKVPGEVISEKWITGETINQETYYFISRKSYSVDVINNLENIGFFEQLYKLISDNNKNKILPEIKGIQSIECLDCGGMQSATPNTALFGIQIRIKYKEN